MERLVMQLCVENDNDLPFRRFSLNRHLSLLDRGLEKRIKQKIIVRYMVDTLKSWLYLKVFILIKKRGGRLLNQPPPPLVRDFHRNLPFSRN